MKKKIINRMLRLLIAGSAMTCLAFTSSAQTAASAASTAAQTPDPVQVSAPEKTQARRVPRRATTPPARVTVVADQAKVAPQVVTIVHRLSGVKMLRFLQRQEGESGTVYTIDREAISDDAHASIIAGWVLADGRTIAARLPQAGAEFEFTMPFAYPAQTGQPGTRAAARSLLPPRTEPDLTVITRDGRKLRAHYVGLDGETGLSVLQVNVLVMPQSAEGLAKELIQGQGVQIFAPERTTPEGEASSRIIYVKLGEVDGKIADLTRTNTGKPQRLTIRSAKLSPLVIGGVACDEAGNTLGIVDAIEGQDAQIVPADNIRAAARRVLKQQTSVPRPLLGVSGEPVEFAARASFLANGWNDDQLAELTRQQVGILLTSIMPGTPAAFAKLHSGDVIVSVDKEYVKSGEEFSKLLRDAGSGKQVQFLVRRPGAAEPLAIDVMLGGSFDPLFKWRLEMPVIAARVNGFERIGVETMTLSTGGLLVVAVQPESIAAKGGMLEGDVIESIDGRSVGRGTWPMSFEFSRQKKHVVSLIRNREKKQVVLEAVE